MARIYRDQIIRKLDEAEGYLMLDLPQHALGVLQGRSDWSSMQFEASFLTGEALRSLGRFRDALKPLELASKLRPDDIGVALSLGWCYKRTHRLAQAIDALERASREHPEEALLHYNLACYWSLAGNAPRAFDELTIALDLDPDLRERLADEPDFDRIRDDPEFTRITTRQAPQV